MNAVQNQIKTIRDERVQSQHPIHRLKLICKECGGTGSKELPWHTDCSGMKHQEFTK